MRTRPLFLAAALCVAALAPAAQADTALADNFDSNGLRLDFAPSGWALTTEGRVSIIGSSALPGAAPAVLNDVLPGNGAYIDLIGTSGAVATLVSPDVSLLSGIEYTASFALAGNQSLATEHVLVSFGDAQQTFTLAPTAGFQTYTLAFTPSSSAVFNITFQTVDSAVNIGPGPTGERGALLDALVITSVPEPASYGLLLAGLAGLHLVARRRLQG